MLGRGAKQEAKQILKSQSHEANEQWHTKSEGNRVRAFKKTRRQANQEARELRTKTQEITELKNSMARIQKG